MKRILWAILLFVPAFALADLHPSNGIANSSNPQAATFNVSSGTVTTFYASSATISHIIGTVTSDNATVGTYGEYVSSSAAVSINTTATTQFTNVAQIAITAGDWDVSGCGYGTVGSATPTRMQTAISLFSGNTTTDHVLSYNLADGAPPAVAFDMVQCLSSFRVSTATSTTVYIKVSLTYPAAQPQARGTITARRVR